MPSAVRVRALANELATLQAGHEVNVGKELVMPSADRGGAEGCEPAPTPAGLTPVGIEVTAEYGAASEWWVRARYLASNGRECQPLEQGQAAIWLSRALTRGGVACLAVPQPTGNRPAGVNLWSKVKRKALSCRTATWQGCMRPG